MSLTDIRTNFRKQSVLILIVLSLITIWMYALAWFVRQSKTINRLLPTNPISSSFVVFCIIFAVVNIAFIPLEIITDDDPTVMRVSNMWGLLDIILTIIWSFMVRDRINQISNGRGHWLNGLATLLLGPFYMQYKINRMIEAPVNEAEQVAAPDTSRGSSGTPLANS